MGLGEDGEAPWILPLETADDLINLKRKMNSISAQQKALLTTRGRGLLAALISEFCSEPSPG
jgi:hypothetical protein